MLNRTLYQIGMDSLDITVYSVPDKNLEHLTAESEEMIKAKAEKAYADDTYESIEQAYFLIAFVYGTDEANKFLEDIGYDVEKVA